MGPLCDPPSLSDCWRCCVVVWNLNTHHLLYCDIFSHGCRSGQQVIQRKLFCSHWSHNFGHCIAGHWPAFAGRECPVNPLAVCLNLIVHLNLFGHVWKLPYDCQWELGVSIFQSLNHCLCGVSWSYLKDVVWKELSTSSRLTCFKVAFVILEQLTTLHGVKPIVSGDLNMVKCAAPPFCYCHQLTIHSLWLCKL